ncbi:MAG: hypothetical protein ACYS47_00670 [Planctomycetota bacterium]|jgi:hypothetical protein
MPNNRVLKFLLYVRYILGNVAAAFLVAVPARMILVGGESDMFLSLAYGVVFLLGFALLIPVSRFDWRTVTVPQFMRFELVVHFYSSTVSAVLLGASLLVPALSETRKVFWIVFLINLFAWGTKKVNVFLFRTRYDRGKPVFDASASTVVEGDTVVRPRPDA